MFYFEWASAPKTENKQRKERKMPIPLIPVIAGGAALLAGAFGVAKGAKAIKDNSEADDINSEARRLFRRIKARLGKSRSKARDALTRLGQVKMFVSAHSVRRFVSLFERIKNIELANSNGVDELSSFRIDRAAVVQMREMCDMAASIGSGTLSGAVAGSALAFGAYSAAGALATASTGTAIAGLSGAAATNATLAFFGGGSLAAGGLGMAGGMAVLGSVVAGPALAVMGAVMGAKASENLDNAYSNMAKAEKAEEEVNTLVSMCNAIAKRSDMISLVLIKLNKLAEPMMAEFDRIIRTEGVDYKAYSEASKRNIAALLSTMQATKAIFDTALLTKKGGLTPASKKVLSAVQGQLEDKGETIDCDADVIDVIAEERIPVKCISVTSSKSTSTAKAKRIAIRNPATGAVIKYTGGGVSKRKAKHAVAKKAVPRKAVAAKKAPAKKAALRRVVAARKAPAK